MNRILALPLVACLCLPAVAAQKTKKKRPRRTAGFAALVRNKAVQKELKVTEDQQKKLQDAAASAQKGNKSLSGLKGDERRKKSREVNKKLRETVAGILEEKQQQRLLQIEIQYSSGSWIIHRKGVAEQLELTREQKKQMREISNKMAAASRKLRAGQDDTNKQETQRNIRKNADNARTSALALLTKEQLAKWKTVQGEPFKLPRGKRKKKRE